MISFSMECKFNYLQGILFICHYFSKNLYLQLSKKLDIKHLHMINFKKISLKKFFKIMFPLCMEWKFKLKHNFGFFKNFTISLTFDRCDS